MKWPMVALKDDQHALLLQREIIISPARLLEIAKKWPGQVDRF
jgi:hypothetical protein